MKLQLTNHIRFGDETEIIQEIHDCEWREKGAISTSSIKTLTRKRLSSSIMRQN